MFSIETARQFFEKLLADQKDFKDQPDSARHALNCIITAYHLREWVWGEWLQNDSAALQAMKIQQEDDFVPWIKEQCPRFETVRQLTNGAKHFRPKSPPPESFHVGGFGSGPFGAGAFGKPYLLIDHGEAEGVRRWQTAEQLIDLVVDFWSEFFAKYHPDSRKPGSS